MAQETSNQDNQATTPAATAQATIPSSQEAAAPNQDNQGMADETTFIINNPGPAIVPPVEQEVPTQTADSGIAQGAATASTQETPSLTSDSGNSDVAATAAAQETPKGTGEETSAEGSTTNNAHNGLIIRGINDQIITCSRPLTRFKLFDIGDRTTIVTLQSGRLVAFSPGPLTDAVKRELNKRGNKVRYLVIMNKGPRANHGNWRIEYPNAQVIAPEGFVSEQDIHHRLTEENCGNIAISNEFDADIDIVLVHAHPRREVAFLHKPSRTMIVGNLIFNLPAQEQYDPAEGFRKAAILSRGLTPVLSASGRALGMRMLYLWYHMATRARRRAFKASVASIDAWDFDTIIPYHGEVITDVGKEAFRTIFKGYLPSRENSSG